MADNIANIQVGVTVDRASLTRAEKQITSALSNIEKLSSSGSLFSRSFSQPLGRISGQISEFEKSLEAANARVVAFGASAGAIFQLTAALGNLIKSTIEVEKEMANLNSVLNVGERDLKNFGDSLFDIARKTGQSFQSVARAATEFSRQGLNVEKTLQRTRDALILSRLTGLDVVSSTEALTAAINSFNDAAIDSTVIINKLASVDAQFAVSSADLAEAVKRVGSSAVDAGLSLDELIATVTVAQQRTARGGAVIGNSLKTIFTRVQRTDTLDQLQSLGVEVRNAQGDILPAVKILQNFSKAYDQLGQSQKSAAAELVGGVFQINILKAVVSDLSSSFSQYDKVLKVSTGATDEAIVRSENLNKTLSALLNETVANLTKFGSEVGNVTVGPAIRSVLEQINNVIDTLSIKDKDSFGGKLATGILTGLGKVLSGPGLALITLVIGKIAANFTTFGISALKTFTGINAEAQKQAEIQQLIQGILLRNPSLINAASSSAEAQVLIERELLNLITARNIALEQSAILSRKFASTITPAALASINTTLKGSRTKSGGFIPNYINGASQEVIGALNGGYMPGKVVASPVGGVMNTAEEVKYVPGFTQPFINPPQNSKAGREHRQNSIWKTGINPYSSGGFIPHDLAGDPLDGGHDMLFHPETIFGVTAGHKSYLEASLNKVTQNKNNKKTAHITTETMGRGKYPMRDPASGGKSVSRALYEELIKKTKKSTGAEEVIITGELLPQKGFPIFRQGLSRVRLAKKAKGLLSGEDNVGRVIEKTLNKEQLLSALLDPSLQNGFRNPLLNLTTWHSKGHIPNKYENIRNVAASLSSSRVMMRMARDFNSGDPNKVHAAGNDFEAVALKAATKLFQGYPRTELHSIIPTRKLKGEKGISGGKSFPGFDFVAKLTTMEQWVADELGISVGKQTRIPISAKGGSSTKFSAHIDMMLGKGSDLLKHKGKRLPLAPPFLITSPIGLRKAQKDKLRQVNNRGIVQVESGGFIPNFTAATSGVFYDFDETLAHYPPDMKPSEFYFPQSVARAKKTPLANSLIREGKPINVLTAREINSRDAIKNKLEEWKLPVNKVITSGSMYRKRKDLGKISSADKKAKFLQSIHSKFNRPLSLVDDARQNIEAIERLGIPDITAKLYRMHGQRGLGQSFSSEGFIPNFASREVMAKVFRAARASLHPDQSREVIKKLGEAPGVPDSKFVEIAIRKYGVKGLEGLLRNLTGNKVPDIDPDSGLPWSEKDDRDIVAVPFPKPETSMIIQKAARRAHGEKAYVTVKPWLVDKLVKLVAERPELKNDFMSLKAAMGPGFGASSFFERPKAFSKGFIPNFKKVNLSGVKAIDGDTITGIPSEMVELSFRLSGVDAPEKNQILYVEAKNIVDRHLKIKGNQIKNVGTSGGGFGRGLFEDDDLSEELLTKGLAVPDLRFYTGGKNAVGKAKKDKRGLWKEEYKDHPKRLQYEYQERIVKGKDSARKKKQELKFEDSRKAFGLEDLQRAPKRRSFDGFIPNFAPPELTKKVFEAANRKFPYRQDPIQDAIARESAAGIPLSNIKIGRDKSLIGPQNPLGLGVFNTLQERNLKQGIKFAREAGVNPKTKGAASGFVPNFADEGAAGIAIGVDVLALSFVIRELKDSFSKLKVSTNDAIQTKLKEARVEESVIRKKISDLGGEKGRASQNLRRLEKLKEETIGSGNRVTKKLEADIASAKAKVSEFTSRVEAQRGELAMASARTAQAARAKVPIKERIGSFLQGGGASALISAPLIAEQIAAFIPETSRGGIVAKSAVSGLGGIAAAAGTGALIGSAIPIPVVGTAVGAGVGALIGLAGAISDVSKSSEKYAEVLRVKSLESIKANIEKLRVQSEIISKLGSSFENFFQEGDIKKRAKAQKEIEDLIKSASVRGLDLKIEEKDFKNIDTLKEKLAGLFGEIDKQATKEKARETVKELLPKLKTVKGKTFTSQKVIDDRKKQLEKEISLGLVDIVTSSEAGAIAEIEKQNKEILAVYESSRERLLSARESLGQGELNALLVDVPSIAILVAENFLKGSKEAKAEIAKTLIATEKAGKDQESAFDILNKFNSKILTSFRNLKIIGELETVTQKFADEISSEIEGGFSKIIEPFTSKESLAAFQADIQRTQARRDIGTKTGELAQKTREKGLDIIGSFIKRVTPDKRGDLNQPILNPDAAKKFEKLTQEISSSIKEGEFLKAQTAYDNLRKEVSNPISLLSELKSHLKELDDSFGNFFADSLRESELLVMESEHRLKIINLQEKIQKRILEDQRKIAFGGGLEAALDPFKRLQDISKIQENIAFGGAAGDKFQQGRGLLELSKTLATFGQTGAFKDILSGTAKQGLDEIISKFAPELQGVIDTQEIALKQVEAALQPDKSLEELKATLGDFSNRIGEKIDSSKLIGSQDLLRRAIDELRKVMAGEVAKEPTTKAAEESAAKDEAEIAIRANQKADAEIETLKKKYSETSTLGSFILSADDKKRFEKEAREEIASEKKVLDLKKPSQDRKDAVKYPKDEKIAAALKSTQERIAKQKDLIGGGSFKEALRGGVFGFGDLPGGLQEARKQKLESIFGDTLKSFIEFESQGIKTEESIDAVSQAFKDYQNNLITEAELKSKLAAATSKLNLSLTQQNFDKGIVFVDELRQSIKAANEEAIKNKEFGVGNLTDAIKGELTYGTQDFQKEANDAITRAAASFRDGTTDALFEAIKGTKSLKEAFSDMFAAIADDLLKSGLRMAINSLFDSIGGRGGLLSNLFNKGGLAKGYASGGKVVGGSGVRDDVPAYLSKGEFVMRKAAVQKYGLDYLESLNSGSTIKRQVGGEAVIFRGQNEYLYNDPKRPTKGKLDVDERLSILALTDEDNPQNRIRMEREERLLNYLADKAEFDREQAKIQAQFKAQKRKSALGALIGAGISLGSFGISQKIGKYNTLRGFRSYIDSPINYKNRNSSKYMVAARGGLADDNVPALLTGGEYVIRKDAVDKYGVGFFNRLNSGSARGFAEGGLVGGVASPTASSAGGANTNNISITVNVSNDGSTNTGARTEGKAVNDKNARALAETINNAVIRTIIEQQKPGGLLYR